MNTNEADMLLHPIRYSYNVIEDAFFSQLNPSDLSLQEKSFHRVALLAFFNINRIFFSKFFKPSLD